MGFTKHLAMQVTQIQTGQLPKLFHIQTNTYIDFPSNSSIIHIGKPNTRIPPDIDVSHLPNSKLVSRVHAHILVEGQNYSIEDLGSANGTYLNHRLLTPLTLYDLRQGDRIDLGKKDKVTFLFQLPKNIPVTTSKAEDEEEEHVALLTKLLGLGLMLGGLGFLVGSIIIGGILHGPLIVLTIAGLVVLNYRATNPNLGRFSIGIGLAIAIATGTIILLPLTLLPFLLGISAFSAGYQLFTSGKILNYNLLSLKRVLKSKPGIPFTEK
jgi:pSer/pThr/pTyr-binding forkhead associated (FHA) protein